MSLSRRNPRRDANEKEIVTGLRKLGCEVLQLSGAGVPDLAVYVRGRWYLAEIKSRGGELTPRQHWGKEVRLWRSLEEACIDLGLLNQVRQLK